MRRRGASRNKAEIRPRQSQGAAAVLDGAPDGQGLQRQGHQSAEGKAGDERHQRVQTTVSPLHDRRQLQGTGYKGSGLPGLNLQSRLDGDRRCRRSIRPRRSRRDSKAGVRRQGRHSIQVLLSSTRPK
ncbi:MAG: hypothetical protein ACKPKO_42775, partial [Candidatus Fonsibacter sp.]